MDSFSYYCKTKLCRPEERTYVVFLYYPPINFHRKNNLKLNVAPEKVTSILKQEHSNTILTIKSDSASSGGACEVRKKSSHVSITEFDTEFLNWYKSRTKKRQSKPKKQTKQATKTNKVHPSKDSPKDTDSHTDYEEQS